MPSLPRHRPTAARAARARRTGVALAALLVLACAGGPAPMSLTGDNPLAGAPSWLTEGCQMYWSDGGARICGVGSMAGTRNVVLARTAAIGRARVGIGRTLESKVASMLGDFAQTPAGAELAARSDRETYIQDVARQITQLALPATELVDSWVGPDGTLHTLVALEAEKFERTLDDSTSLSEPLRLAVRERARASFALSTVPVR